MTQLLLLKRFTDNYEHLRTYINAVQSLCKNIFSISENRATRKPNNSNIKHSTTVRSCLNNNCYHINDLLIIVNIK